MSRGLSFFRLLWIVPFFGIVLCWAVFPAHAAIVSGTVTDGSGHGWPLYARIDITGYAGGPVFTDPANGTYSVDLPESVVYTFNVAAVGGNYAPQSVLVIPPPEGITQDFALTVAPITGCPPGYTDSIIYHEDFESGYANWTMDGLWNAESETDPCGSLVAPFPSPTHAVYYGQDGICNYNIGTYTYGDLTSSSVSIPSEGRTTLTYSSYGDTECVEGGSCNTFREIRISTNAGAQWNWLESEQTEEEWSQKRIDLTEYAGQNALLQFSFSSNFGAPNFGWMIDDITLTNSASCQPVTGGLLVGNIYNVNTSLGINDIAVTSNDRPSESVRSFATLEDPGVEDGYYILFSSLVGVHPFTAARVPCVSDTQYPSVVTDGVVVQNFSLQCGQITASPVTLEATVQIGHSLTLPLTLENIGGISADFLLTESEGASVPVVPLDSHQGPPARRIPGHFSLQRLLNRGPAIERPGLPEAVSSVLSTPWRPIADYPVARAGSSAAAINGLVYSVGGTDFDQVWNEGYVYDPAADSWTPIAPMTHGRYLAGAVAINGLLYVFGGVDYSNVPIMETEIYDPSTNQWSTGAPMLTPYMGSVAVNLNDKAYVLPGLPLTEPITVYVQVYDPASDSWSIATSYPEISPLPFCGVFNGKMYCGGGYAFLLGGPPHTYSYDPITDEWTQLATMPDSRFFPSFAMSDAKLYISGGLSGEGMTNEGLAYDVMLDIWEPIASANYTAYASASACGFYKIGGMNDSGAVASSEVYPGLNDCEQSDVPWLSESATTGSVPALDSQVVDVILDATEITEPGDYLAHLNISETTVYDVPDIQVILHVPACPVMTLDPPALPGAITGTPYAQTFTAGGGAGPYIFSVTAGALPDGLVLDPSGTLTGIPTIAGVFDFEVTATDTEDCEESLSYTIQVSCPAISLGPPTLPDGSIGVAYDQTLAGIGGTAPYTFAITMGALPPGLTLDLSGSVSGIPSVAGTFPFLVVGTDLYGCAETEIYAIHINPCTATIALAPPSLPDGFEGTAYNQTITAMGGTPPYTFTVTAGALPDGLTMDSGGVISGTPTTIGSFDFEVTAADAGGCAGAADYTIEIGPPCLFCDDFEDGTPAAEWNYVKPLWKEEGGQLVGISAGGKAVATADFGGCLACYHEAELTTAGGPYNKVWMLGWFQDKRNTMELLLKEENDKILLKQRAGNRIVKKSKATFNIEPNVPITLRIAFDGAQFIVWANGTQLFTLTPAAAVPNGGTGFQVKNTTLYVNGITVGQ